jgi:hypothetical protein
MGLTPTRLLDYLTRSPCELIPEEGVRSKTRELAIAHQTTLQRGANKWWEFSMICFKTFALPLS